MNICGQLGDRTTTSRLIPVLIITNRIAKVIAVDFHSLALKTDGTVWAWGYNLFSELGVCTTAAVHTIQVNNLSDVIDISRVYITASRLNQDGSVYSWGMDMEASSGFPLIYSTVRSDHKYSIRDQLY
jgi:alpha-tubulin suppressor-like RCC1 family protein